MVMFVVNKKVILFTALLSLSDVNVWMETDRDYKAASELNKEQRDFLNKYYPERQKKYEAIEDLLKSYTDKKKY